MISTASKILSLQENSKSEPFSKVNQEFVNLSSIPPEIHIHFTFKLVENWKSWVKLNHLLCFNQLLKEHYSNSQRMLIQLARHSHISQFKLNVGKYNISLIQRIDSAHAISTGTKNGKIFTSWLFTACVG